MVPTEIERWFQQKGGEHPCAFKGPAHDLQQHTKTKVPSVWIHKSGVKLSAGLYRLAVVGSRVPEAVRFIVVEGESMEPLVDSYQSGYFNVSNLLGIDDATGAGYKIWHGVDSNAKGFEAKPSVYKINASFSRHVHLFPTLLTEDPCLPDPRRPGVPSKTVLSIYPKTYRMFLNPGLDKMDQSSHLAGADISPMPTFRDIVTAREQCGNI